MHKKYYYLFVLILLVLITRLPFQSSRLYSWDAVQYALALKEYNVSKYQPHPSGYPVYVFAAKIFFHFLKDENKSFLYLNLLLSIVAVFFLFKISVIFFKENIAFLITLLFISSPLFWSNAEVAVSYCAESAISLMIAYFCYLQILKKKIYIELGILLGLGAGFRPNLILFLLPLVFFSCFKVFLTSEIKLKFYILKISLLFFLFIIWSLIWYVYMINLSGGYKIYSETLTSQFEFISKFSIFQQGIKALIINGKNILIAIFFAGFCFATFIPLILAVNLKQFLSKKQPLNFNNFLFFIFWIFPPLLFYLFIFVDLSAYALSYLPPLFILLGYFFLVEEKTQKYILTFVVFLVFIANTLVFTKINYPLQQKNIKNWQLKENFIKKLFSPKNTLLLGGFYAGINKQNYFRQAMFFLPQYTAIFIPGVKLNLDSRLKHIGFAKDKNFIWYYPEKNNSKYCFLLPEGFANVVLLDDYLINTIKKNKNLKIKKASTSKIYFLVFSKLDKLCYKYNELDFK